MTVLLPEVEMIQIPELKRVEQIYGYEHVENIEEHVSLEIQGMGKEIDFTGKKIAVAVGSRGISNIDRIVRATLDQLISMGAHPFIVAAMGSHGGGTTEGQLEILESYGITETSMGVPIVAQQRVVVIGKTNSGVPVMIDKAAYEADMIVVMNRVKTHTDFTGPIESGLCKMLAIGLGKHMGCSRYHDEGFDSFAELIPEIASVVIANANIVFGVAIIENAYGQTYDIKAVLAGDILDEEPKMLEKANQLKASIMIRNIDLLIVDEIGKDISGGGMDPKVTGLIGYKDKWKLPGFKGPNIQLVFVLGLSEATHGNANGIGIADFALKSLLDQMDFDSSYANALAAKAIEGVKIPALVDTYEDGIKYAFAMTNYSSISQMRIVRIKNTLSLGMIEVSANLLPEVLSNPKMRVLYESFIIV